MVNRTLADLKEIFSNTKDVDENITIYSYDNTVPKDANDELLHGVTTIHAGTVNGEYYMTKGHTHVIPSAETYYGLAGSGIVLCEKEDDILEMEIQPGILVYCPPGYAHRVINTSSEDLSFLCVCRADAGHDYSIKFTKRYFLN